MTTDDDRTRLSNLAVVEAYADAWTAGEAARIFALYSDGMTLHWHGANPLAGSHRGKPAAVAALMAFTGKTGRKLLAVRHVMACPHRATMIVEEELGGRAVERILVFRVEAGLLAECWAYDAEQAWVDGLLAA